MLSRKNFYISSKIFFTLISLIMLIPLTFLTIFFDFYSLRLLNAKSLLQTEMLCFSIRNS